MNGSGSLHRGFEGQPGHLGDVARPGEREGQSAEAGRGLADAWDAAGRFTDVFEEPGLVAAERDRVRPFLHVASDLGGLRGLVGEPRDVGRRIPLAKHELGSAD